MRAYEIYIALVSWETGGKRRPVLFLEEDNGYARIFSITTQYENKSNAIKAGYFAILDWEQSGLSKASYIDTIEKIRLPLAAFSSTIPIGKLTASDLQRLFDFLTV